MKFDRNTIALTLIISSVVLVVLGVTLGSLYQTAINQQKQRLEEFVRGQAQLIGAVARFDAEYSYADVAGGAFGATVGQVIDAFAGYRELGETGELLLARRVDDHVSLLLRSRATDSDPSTLPLSSPLGALLAEVIDGRSGTGVVVDLDEVEVLAAFAPVPELGLGLLAKIHLDELRYPFVVAGAISTASTVVLIFLGAALSGRVISPLQRRLRESQTNIDTFFESPTEGMFLLSDGVYAGCNAHLGEILGCDREELLGKSPLEFSPETQPDGRSSLDAGMAHFTKMLAHGPQYLFWQHRRSDGRPVDTYISLREVTLEGQSLILGTVHDVTRLRETEAELSRASRQIEEQRDHLAHVGRLSLLGEMTASIAHEINQPLTAISNYTQAALRMAERDGKHTEALSDALRKSAEQVQRAAEVIRRLRGFVRKDEGVRERVDLNDVVRDVFKLAEVDARHHGIQIELGLSEEVLAVSADPIQLQQVLLNLVRNAMEAMEETDEVTVSIETGEQAGRVYARVKDRGVGLSKVEERVFEPFFTTKDTGLGMGLAISKSIAEEHHGRLECEPNPDGGAIFVLTLPLASQYDDSQLGVPR